MTLVHRLTCRSRIGRPATGLLLRSSLLRRLRLCQLLQIDFDGRGLLVARLHALLVEHLRTVHVNAYIEGALGERRVDELAVFSVLIG